VIRSGNVAEKEGLYDKNLNFGLLVMGGRRA
jgi:hypothetical protein